MKTSNYSTLLPFFKNTNQRLCLEIGKFQIAVVADRSFSFAQIFINTKLFKIAKRKNVLVELSMKVCATQLPCLEIVTLFFFSIRI